MNPEAYRLLRSEQVEQMLSVGKNWCAKDRCLSGQQRIPYVKIGRTVRYRIEDVEAFIKSAKHLDDNPAASAMG